MGFVGIKVANTGFNAAIAKTIRKYRNIPIAEIKDLVQDNDYLFTCSYVDPEGINMLLQIYHDFCNATFRVSFMRMTALLLYKSRITGLVRMRRL